MISETSKNKSSKGKSLFFQKNYSTLTNRKLLSNSDRKNERINLDKKIRIKSETKNKKLSKTNFMSLSQEKDINTKSLKFPLLSKAKPNDKKNYFLNDEQRLINYNKMRNYRIKLIKVSKAKPKIDNVYQLFKDNGLQFLFPPPRKSNGEIDVKNSSKNIKKSKLSKKKLRISSSSQNLNELKYNLISPEADINNLKSLKKKTLVEDEDIYKPSFKKYMKLQSLADMKFRPVLGDTSSDLVNFLKKIELIRKEVINNYIDEINNVENRVNIELPKEDFKFKTKMQGLYQHKWKNIFSLRDYQDLFCENLKGKISNKNFDIMERNFRNIFLMCFSSGISKSNNL